MATGRTTSHRLDNEDIKVWDTFCLLGTTFNSKRRRKSSQEMCCRQVFNRAAMNSLGKTIQCCNLSMPTKIRIIQATVFAVTSGDVKVRL